MIRSARRHRNYEVTKEGRISIYPSMDEQGGRHIQGGIAAFLKRAAMDLVSVIRSKERSGSLK